MRVSSRSMGLGGVLLLLLLLDSSSAQTVKRQKITDPNYMDMVMHEGHHAATTTTYKQHAYGSKSSKSTKATAKATFTVESCTVKFPGIVPSATPTDSNAVSFLWSFGCTTSTGTQSAVGSCFGSGITDTGISYIDSGSDNTTNVASVTFTCELDPELAEECNSKLKCLDEEHKLMVTGQGRLAFTFVPTDGTTLSSFAIAKPTADDDQPHLAVTGVPLTKYTQGFAMLDVTGCLNGNPNDVDPNERSSLPQSERLPTGSKTKFALMLA